MERKSKNIICILLIVISIGVIAGTIYFASKNLSTSSTTETTETGKASNNGLKPPEMPSGDNSNGNMTPPDMNDDSSNSSNRPSKPGSNSSSSSSESQSDKTESQMPPAKPDSENDSSKESENSDNVNQTPPEMPSGDNQMQFSKEMPTTTTSSEVKLTMPYTIALVAGVVLFSISVSYLLFSLFGKNKVFKNVDKTLIFILTNIIVSAILTYGVIYFTNNKILSDKTITSEKKASSMPGESSSSISASGANEVTKKLNEDSKTYKSESEDENAILVKNEGNLTLTNATITKTGDTSNTESSEFYGINAAVLVQKGSTATISGGKITTNAKGSNAVFSTGSDSKIYIKDSTINTSSNSSRGLDATYGGYIEADNVTIKTQGNSCATLATDRGEGTVKVTNSKLETNGQGSPIIYSTGDISLTNSTGTSNGSQLVVIEGKNNATVSESTLIASGIGNRNNVDNAGVMIYQSMSGDASEGTGTFTAKNSTLTIDSSSKVYKTAPFFFITNTDAVINLTNTKLIYGSNMLISIKGTDEWGKSGSNGGNLTFNSTDETLNGNIEVDNISTLIMNLKSTTLTSTINASNTAKKIEINLDKNSTWNVTGDSYVTILNDDDTSYKNIKSNGYTIYYDKDSNSSLNGKTITLSDGGKLTPAK